VLIEAKLMADQWRRFSPADYDGARVGHAEVRICHSRQTPVSNSHATGGSSCLERLRPCAGTLSGLLFPCAEVESTAKSPIDGGSYLCSPNLGALWCFSSPMVQGRGIRTGFMEMGRAADSARDPKLLAVVGTASGIRPILAADVAAYRVRARFCSEVDGRADKWAHTSAKRGGLVRLATGPHQSAAHGIQAHSDDSPTRGGLPVGGPTRRPGAS
jgi:hypothetical protein